MSQTPELPEEAGRHNLRRALLELPRHHPADALWPRIEGQLHAEPNLYRAIRELPAHEPLEALWARIEDGLSGAPNLRRAVQALPTHEPLDEVWTRIDAQLTGERAIDHATRFLPEHEPDDDLWAAISARLDEAPAAPSPLLVLPDTDQPATPSHFAPAPVLRRLWTAHMWRVAASVAAAVLLVAAGWWLRPYSAPETTVAAVQTAPAAQETISYSEEVVTLPAEAPQATYASFDPLENQGVSFIDAHCTSLPTVCRSSEFQELRSQLTELEAEEQRLQKDVRRFGSTPELVQDQVRVTTLKATVTRELIQMLIS